MIHGGATSVKNASLQKRNAVPVRVADTGVSNLLRTPAPVPEHLTAQVCRDASNAGIAPLRPVCGHPAYHANQDVVLAYAEIITGESSRLTRSYRAPKHRQLEPESALKGGDSSQGDESGVSGSTRVGRGGQLPGSRARKGSRMSCSGFWSPEKRGPADTCCTHRDNAMRLARTYRHTQRLGGPNLPVRPACFLA